MKKAIGHFLLVFGIAVAAATPSFAQLTQTFQFPSSSTDDTVYVTTTGGSYFETQAGLYASTLGGTATPVFCVDPPDDINWGQSYTTVDPENALTKSTTPIATETINGSTFFTAGLTDPIGTTGQNLNTYESNGSTVSAQKRVDEAAYLIEQNYGDVANSDQAAAAQLAIWEVIEDGGYNGSSVLTGNFAYETNTVDSTVNSDVTTDLQAAYNAYVANPTATYGNVLWIQPPTTQAVQSFAYVNSSLTQNGNPIVPEPNIGAFLVSLATALGIMTLLKRRSMTLS